MLEMRLDDEKQILSLVRNQAIREEHRAKELYKELLDARACCKQSEPFIKWDSKEWSVLDN